MGNSIEDENCFALFLLRYIIVFEMRRLTQTAS